MTDNVARIIMSAHGEGQKQRAEQHHEIHALILGQLYMTVHVRKGNSDRLFEVDNSDYPPSLSKHGVIRSGQNSDLLPCWEVDCPSDSDEADAKLIDGANNKNYGAILGRIRASNHSVITPIRR